MRAMASTKRRSVAINCCRASSCIDAIIHLDLQFVDGVLFADHGLRKLLVGFEHGMRGLMRGALRQAAHPEQSLLQFFEVVLKMTFHRRGPFSRKHMHFLNENLRKCVAAQIYHPKRPVMYASVRESVGVVNSLPGG